MSGYTRRDDEEDKGLIWKLPELKMKELGKVGPAFGAGIGCGAGFGAGLVGGVGFGPGLPGLQLGIGFGAGCGVGVGFGYGVGRGVAHDDNRKYSNIGKFNGFKNLPSQNVLVALMDELVISTRKIAHATSKELDKWRR